MPKPAIFSYEKKEPYRDAFYFMIVNEGEKTEIKYFNFFEGLSSRVQLIAVPAKGGSAPKYFIETAKEELAYYGADDPNDQVWFVVDTDRWGENSLRELRLEAESKGWFVVQSNPCFEVWLYFHAKPHVPEELLDKSCTEWKPFVRSTIRGGFNPDFHPASIETATIHAKGACVETGYLPHSGSTQVWRLAEALLKIIGKELSEIRHKFPDPVVE